MADKEQVDHILDLVERVFAELSPPVNIGELADQAVRQGDMIHMLLVCAVRRPEKVKARPKLWSIARDWLNGIESGVLPEPAWWKSAHEGMPKETE